MMPTHIVVLASGSGGNATLIKMGSFGILVDVGLGPRQLGGKLAAHGYCWDNVNAVVLTHTHSDHWKEATLANMLRRAIPLYCHPAHHADLQSASPAFTQLRDANLLHAYAAGKDLELAAGFRFRPLLLAHDGIPTFGFRFRIQESAVEPEFGIGYVADLGSWRPELVQCLAGVKVLALEFNHDVGLEYSSGRSPHLIARVLGDHGHLSNSQAAALLEEVLTASAPGQVCHIIQLHLSRDCNRHPLAEQAARAVLQRFSSSIKLHTAKQEESGPAIMLSRTTIQSAEASQPSKVDKPGPVALSAGTQTGLLPGFDQL
jgi:phosphoribosyl 1,2-cyclic phosphodiesterase